MKSSLRLFFRNSSKKAKTRIVNFVNELQVHIFNLGLKCQIIRNTKSFNLVSKFGFFKKTKNELPNDKNII